MSLSAEKFAPIECVAGHESPEIDSPRIVISASVLVGSIVIACIVSQWVFSWLLRPMDERSPTPLNGIGLVLPAAPRLEGIEMLSGEASNGEHVKATRQLQTYGWVDRDKRLIHVPIDRAIQLAIERKLLPTAVQPPNSASDSNATDAAPSGPKLNTP